MQSSATQELAAASPCSVPQGLLQLFRENGLPIPLQKCGPCQVRQRGRFTCAAVLHGMLHLSLICAAIATYQTLFPCGVTFTT